MVFYLLLGITVGINSYVLYKLHKVFNLFRVPLPSVNPNDIENLPSVSLCIPARNETHAMTDCIESALRSSYPKLEIIVLDDGSRDDTGHLIKSFAHAGVRFVEGTKLPDGWLGKNHALDGLFRQASGSIILFADVDTRFSIDSISQMVGYMTKEHVDMVSVLPARQNTMRSSAIFATFRNFWNITGHTTKNPAAASNAWMVKRTVLTNTIHGFSDISRSVRPERDIARRLSHDSRYRFVISADKLGVTYEKKLSSQYETSYRIYYPDFGLSGVIFRISGLLLSVSPYVFVIYGLTTHMFAIAITSFAVTVMTSLLNAWYLGVLRSSNYGIASICLPFIMIREIYLLVASVCMCKTGKINWKGRPVTVK